MKVQNNVQTPPPPQVAQNPTPKPAATAQTPAAPPIKQENLGNKIDVKA